MLIDADILVDILRQHPPAIQWSRSLSAPVFLSGFAALEVIEGCVNKSEVRRIKRLLSQFPILWPSLDDLTRVYDEYSDLHLSNGVGLLDSLTATTAVGHGLPLATFNTKHFRAIPGLTTVQPYLK